LVPQVCPTDFAKVQDKRFGERPGEAIDKVSFTPASIIVLYSADQTAEGRLDKTGLRRQLSQNSFLSDEGYLKDQDGYNRGSPLKVQFNRLDRNNYPDQGIFGFNRIG